MAQKPDSGMGKLVGGLVTVIMVAGLAASPIYLSAVRNPQSAIDLATQADVELVQNAVLNLDAGLAALADLSQRKIGDEEYWTKLQPAIKSQNDWISKADAAITRLATVRVGDQAGQEQLDVGRAKAQLNLYKARLKLNRAVLHDLDALDARREAESHADHFMAMRQREQAIDLQQPGAVLEKTRENAIAIEAQIVALQGAVDRLKGIITSKETELSALQTAAADARRELLTLESKQGTTPDYRARYEELSNAARRAEADAAAMENGTLRDAKLAEDADDLLTAAYEGGRPELGLRDLRYGLELLEEQLANSTEIRKDLDVQSQAIAEQISSLKKDLDEAREQSESRIQQLNESIETAEAADRLARELEESAWKDLLTASAGAKSAISAAKKRSNDAKQALADLQGAADSRLDMLSKDLETQVSSLCLAADIAYYQGLTRAQGVRARRDLQQCKVNIAGKIGQKAPTAVDGELSAWKDDAETRLAEAAKTYEEAGKLLERASIRTADGTISGKNSIWQIEIAGAAVRLLQADLATDDATLAARKDEAYQMLVEAVKGREQSPLLAPAVATLVYLQQNAD